MDRSQAIHILLIAVLLTPVRPPIFTIIPRFHSMKIPLYLLALALPLCAAEKPHDIVVYGGTSGGIIAAIQAAKSKHSVVLVSPTSYLGGLTTSGLGWTDFGSDAILGGLSRDFYTRVYQHYQKPGA